MRILIIKLGSIGDIVHSLPVLAAIKKQVPNTEVSWVVEQRSAEVLRDNPLIERLVEVDTHALRGSGLDEGLLDISRQIKQLRKLKFDISIDLQGLLKSALIGQLANARQRWGFSKRALREPAARLMLTNTVEPPDRCHVIDKNLFLASAAVGQELTGLKFPIATGEAHIREAATIAEAGSGRFAILDPAGGWVTKLWPAERFGALADVLWERHGLTSIVATGPAESALAEAVLASCRSGKVIHRQPSLKGFYELAKLAAVYIGGDTGPTHLAVAAGAPVIGLFGPTEWWRNGSPRADDICIERSDIGCRIDCHRRKCDAWICMDIGVDAVSSAVGQRLERAGKQETVYA